MAAIGRIAQNRPATIAVRLVLSLVLFALPWIDRTNISTLLLCGLGVFAAFRLTRPEARKAFVYQPVFWLFLVYYAGYIIAWILIPDDPSVRYALQQKSAFAVIPVLLTVLITGDPKLWPLARIAFIAGTAFALACCLVASGLTYLDKGDASVFFYHDLVKLLSANAIYTSVYTLISIAYLIYYLRNGHVMSNAVRTLILILVVFLFGGLLLLSSKLIIVAGIILIIYSIYGHAGSKLRRIGLCVVIVVILGSVFIPQNRINQRFSIVAWRQTDVALKYRDYSNATFDGLNLRLLLWRMGGELLTEKRAWATGLGGKHYHLALNEKIAAYRLYEGYQGIDLHSEYAEALVGFGPAGLLVLLGIISYIFYHSVRQRNALPAILILIFSVSFITESLLETQAGILVFTVIISGEWIQRQYS